MIEQRHIRVLGDGTASGPPDRCIVYTGVNVMADSAAEAVTGVAQAIARALAALRAQGVQPGEIRTTDMSVQDFFDQKEQRVTARIGSYQLEVTVLEIEDVGSVLAALTSVVGESLQVRSLQLTVADPEPLRRAARRLAVQDAQRKATDLAEYAGVRLGAVLSIEDHAPLGGRASQPYRAASAGPGQVVIPPIPVEGGVLSVSSWVTLTYAIAE